MPRDDILGIRIPSPEVSRLFAYYGDAPLLDMRLLSPTLFFSWMHIADSELNDLAEDFAQRRLRGLLDTVLLSPGENPLVERLKKGGLDFDVSSQTPLLAIEFRKNDIIFVGSPRRKRGRRHGMLVRAVVVRSAGGIAEDYWGSRQGGIGIITISGDRLESMVLED